MDNEKEVREFVLKRTKQLIDSSDIRSLKTLGELMGHSENFFSAMFRMKRMPSISSINDICNYLGITLSEFFAPNYTMDKSAESLVQMTSKKLSPKVITKLYDVIENLDEKSIDALLTAITNYHSTKKSNTRRNKKG